MKCQILLLIQHFQLINILKNLYPFFGAELLQCTEIMNDLEIESLI